MAALKQVIVLRRELLFLPFYYAWIKVERGINDINEYSIQLLSNFLDSCLYIPESSV